MSNVTKLVESSKPVQVIEPPIEGDLYARMDRRVAEVQRLLAEQRAHIEALRAVFKPAE